MFKLFYLDREHIPHLPMLFGYTSEWLEAVVMAAVNVPGAGAAGVIIVIAYFA
jgi:hypothetical protein